ncbi:MAG: precorrin-6A/cobalt-precorrin-6A reductase [Thermoleophilia bacterium]|nr:precorrin-6A/cobalt-precorrin-6A reductase [Thermoleophilia bacterium]
MSKESGSDGGLDEKAAAAEMTGARLFILGRPPEPDHVYHDSQTLVQRLEELWTAS